MKELEYTGERIVPNKVDQFLWSEHFARYILAGEFVQGNVILDIGCGTGYGTNYLVHRGAKKVIGIDKSPEAIDYAINHYKSNNVEFQVMDVVSMNFQKNNFDVVTAFEIIEHIEEQEDVISHVKNILKNNGLFLISTPNRDANPLGYVNPFHKKELNYIEFHDLLKNHFKHVKILWQNYFFGIGFTKAMSNTVTLDNSLLVNKEPLQYMIGLCSNKKISIEDKFLPIFSNQNNYLNALTNVRDSHLRTLRDFVEKTQYEQVLEYSKKYPKEKSSDPEWNYLIGFSLSALKRYDEALKHYKFALENGFSEFWVKYNRGCLYSEMGNISAAISDLERALFLNPDHDGARATLNEIKKCNTLPNFLDNTTIYDKHIIWELPVQLCIKDFIKKGDCIIDVGANIGALSIALSRMIGKKGQVHAFEPNPYVFAKLERDLHANNIINVKAINRGIWSKSIGKLPFYCDNTTYSSASSFVRKLNNPKEVVIDVTSLDDYCKQNEIMPQLIKIDAEGAEYEAISGAEETIKKYNPIIVFEYITSNSPKYDLIQHMRRLGYLCYDVNLYKEVDSMHYSTHSKNDIPFNIIAVPHTNTSYAKITFKPISEIQLNGKFSSDLISLESGGRYILRFDFDGPADDNRIAGFKVLSSEEETISLNEANMRILKSHACTNIVIEIDKPTKLKCELFGSDLSGFNFKNIIVEKILLN